VSGRNPRKARRKGAGPGADAPWLSGLLLLALAAYLGLSLTGGTGPWWLAVTGHPQDSLVAGDNPGGPVGGYLALGLEVMLGRLWVWAVPLILVSIGVGMFTGRQFPPRFWLLRVLPLWVATGAFVAQPNALVEPGTGARYGGIVGFYVARGFTTLFGPMGGPIFIFLLLLITVILVLRPWLGWLPGLLERLGTGLAAVGSVLRRILAWPVQLAWRALRAPASWPGALAERRRQARERRAEEEAADGPTGPSPAVAAPVASPSGRARVLHDVPDSTGPAGSIAEFDPGDVEEARSQDAEVRPVTESLTLQGAAGPAEDEGYFEDEGDVSRPRPKKRKKAKGTFVLPDLELLTPAGPDVQPLSRQELDSSADLLEATLRSFGVEGEVKDVRPGPVVTTFEYQPGSGIRVNQIVQRSDDLALAMRARSIRMEAPIPGKAAVGIEIPNPKPKMVRLREVLENTDQEGAAALTVVLGKDVVGRPVNIDIAGLPHLLVAGSTGSGKSVCLNAMICNLLLRNTPETLRLVLIDPKMLELSVYNGIPHLLLPVVTDPREALKALQWMVAQMEYRYRQLSKHSVRNILQYNQKVAKGEIEDEDGETVTEIMPYYVTIVDELADLMIQLGADMEGPITRLAQKARAVGIHLILATQRPSVDVLTGVIKANIPCRIAFRVIQKNDSRTILDMNGAEQLLGHGDMLYLQPGRALPVRVHGSFIDVDECEAISAHWQDFTGMTEEISLNENPAGGGMVTGEDDLFEEAKRIVILHQSGSTSLLQRRLRIGYTRAGRLMDMLEEAGVVGPFTGSKARDVLIKAEDLGQAGEGQA